MEATVITAKCHKTKKTFGIRAQKDNNKWLFTWAFDLPEKTAKIEGYEQTNINGIIDFSHIYPGCPHCGSLGFYQCGNCKKITCWNGEKNKDICPHCGNENSFGKATDKFDSITGNNI